jgi:hypothetical protein
MENSMRKEIWDSLLDADMNVRYWTHLARRYYNYDKFSKIFLAIMASGTVASWGFWINIAILWKILSAISALLAISLPLLHWPKMIENMGSLRQKWVEIKYDYDILWLKHENGKKLNEISEKYEIIKKKEIIASQQEANLPRDNKLIWKSRNEVLESRGLR